MAKVVRLRHTSVLGATYVDALLAGDIALDDVQVFAGGRELLELGRLLRVARHTDNNCVWLGLGLRAKISLEAPDTFAVRSGLTRSSTQWRPMPRETPVIR